MVVVSLMSTMCLLGLAELLGDMLSLHRRSSGLHFAPARGWFSDSEMTLGICLAQFATGQVFRGALELARRLSPTSFGLSAILRPPEMYANFALKCSCVLS